MGPTTERFWWWRHPEPFVCGLRGHVTPVARSRTTGPEHADLVTRTVDGRRLARCLRCDAWVEAPETEAIWEHPPPIEKIERPRRGRELRDALVLRLIAIDRAVHAVLFGIAAIGLWLLEINLPGLQDAARRLTKQGTASLAGPGQLASRDVIVRELVKLLTLRKHSLLVLAVTATIYAALEGTEAVGLWLEKRWAEYLTALATAGFLPFEIHELTKRVTVVRVGALVLNVAVLVWLIWRKHLFGVGRSQAQGRQRVGAPG